MPEVISDKIGEFCDQLNDVKRREPGNHAIVPFGVLPPPRLRFGGGGYIFHSQNDN